MFTAEQYELLDFGQGRKLERFGEYILDRPSASAEGNKPAEPALWSTAHARYDRATEQTGRWTGLDRLPSRWTIEHEPLKLELKPTEFGHLGLFPEHAANWDGIISVVRRIIQGLGRNASPPKILNLFAYTGAASLAAAAAGAEVAHVDAAKNVVASARRNAAASGLAAAPIRWIVEDALTFVRREQKRGNHYDGVILDPPTYGHGPKGQVWQIERHLRPLLEACAALTHGQPRLALLSAHSPGIGPAELEAYLADSFFGRCGQGAQGRELFLQTRSGRRLPSGAAARWP